MREYDVPLDGFSHAGHLFAFFSSNHNRAGRVMGRSVLARAEGDLGIDPTSRSPIRFRVLGTFSDQHFINVSVQLRPATEVPGCEGRGDVLLVWGGPYRAGLPPARRARSGRPGRSGRRTSACRRSLLGR